MNKAEQSRLAFINSAITVVAEKGIQNATTKELSKASGLSEALIYRHFSDKDELLVKTFVSLDTELVDLIVDSVKRSAGASRIELFRSVFDDFWNFVLGNSNKCAYFIQFYYSSYFDRITDDERKKLYSPAIQALAPLFKDGTDIWAEINHMYDVIFPKVLRIIRGSLENSEAVKEGVYGDIRSLEKDNLPAAI